MKKSLYQTLSFAVLLLCSGYASAGDTSTLAVSAKIDGACKFVSKNYSMDFGTITPGTNTGAAAPALATKVTYNCTNGTAVVVAATGGNTRKLTHSVDATAKLSYTLTIGSAPDGAGFGSGAEKSVDVSGTIAQADYDIAKAGTYTENVGLTITP